jgi:hypothetical protein
VPGAGGARLGALLGDEKGHWSGAVGEVGMILGTPRG